MLIDRGKPHSYKLIEASLATGISKDMLIRAIHTTDPRCDPPPLRAKRIGRQYLILPKDLDDWLERLPDA